MEDKREWRAAHEDKEAIAPWDGQTTDLNYVHCVTHNKHIENMEPNKGQITKVDIAMRVTIMSCVYKKSKTYVRLISNLRINSSWTHLQLI